MNFLDQIKDKLTMLQDDFGEDDAPTESDNSTAPTPPPATEPEVEEEEDHGTEDHHDDGHHEPAPQDCAVSLFGDCFAFQIWQWVIQSLTVAIFFVTVTVNFSAPYFMDMALGDVVKYWDLAVDPDGWAFSIWGVIYAGLGLYTFYQMVPSAWIEYLGGKRNDEMIFIYGNLVFIVNMLLNIIWLPTFQSNTQWGFIMSWLIIICLWITNTYMMVISQRFETWWVEVLVMRIPFSIYSGWVTCATVLNTFYMLASWGMKDTPVVDYKYDWWQGFDVFNFLSEEEWTTIALWSVEIFVEIVAYWERNPVWGSVFAWAVAAIISKNARKFIDKTHEHTILLVNAGIIELIHVLSMGTLGAYLIFEELQPWYKPIGFWNGGILGLTDWSLMFKQIQQLLEYPEKYFDSVGDERLATV